MILGLTYKKVWFPKKFKQIKYKIRFTFSIIALLLFGNWSILSFEKIISFYQYLKSNESRFSKQLYQNHPLLGMSAIPNQQTIFFSNCGKLPICTNDLGLRIPCSAEHKITKDIDILFLGCSFTLGNGVIAENTYPFRIASLANKNVLNAGENGYGLARMYLSAQSLITESKPKFLVVQYSSWLTKRAKNAAIPFFQGYISFPYVGTVDNNLVIQTPLFRSNLLGSNLNDFRFTKIGIKDFFNFFFEHGIPIVIVDQLKYWKAKVKLLMGLYPKPIQDEKKIERFILSKIHQLSKNNNAQLILVNIGSWKNYTTYSRKTLINLLPKEISNDLIFVNADSILHEQLFFEEEYNDKYLIWKQVGEDSIICNSHPNSLAHKIIAESVMKQIPFKQ